MRKCVMLLASGVCLLLAAAGTAQNSKPKTVLDYYYLIPGGPFTCDRNPEWATAANRKLVLKTQDIPNGYAAAELSTGTLQVALFRDKVQNRDVVAVVFNCGAGCMCDYQFFGTYDAAHGQWQEVNVLPEAEMEKREAQLAKQWKVSEVYRQITLPRTGTSLVVHDDFSRKAMYHLDWKEGRFVLRP